MSHSSPDTSTEEASDPKEILKHRSDSINSVKQFLTKAIPNLNFITHSCDFQYKKYSLLPDETTSLLHLLVTCPVCNQIIFNDRPSVLIGLAQQYTNNKKLFPFDDPKELINTQMNDVFYGSLEFLDEMLVKKPIEQVLNLPLKCPLHSKEFLFYCKKCDIAVCDDCISAHEEHKNETELIKERIESFEKENDIKAKYEKFKYSLNNIVNFANRVNKLFNDVLDNLSIDPICTKEEIEEIINEHRDEYITSALDNRALAFIWKNIMNLYNKYKYSVEHGKMLKNAKNFNNENIPDIDYSFLNNRPANKEDLLQIIIKAKVIYRTSLFFSPKIAKNQILKISGSYNPYIIDTMKIKDTFEYGENHKSKINFVLCFNERKILVAAEHPTIKYYKVSKKTGTLDLVMKFKKHKKSVNYLEKESDNYFLSCSDDGTVIRWKLTSASIPSEITFKIFKTFAVKYQVLKGHTAKVTQVLSLSKNILCSCSDDKTIRFYFTENNDKEPQLITSLSPNDMKGNFVSMLDSNGILITASTDKVLRFFDYDKEEYLSSKSVNNVECAGVGAMKFLNKNLIIIGGEHIVTTFDITTYQVKIVVNDYLLSKVITISVVNENNLMICDENSVYTLYLDEKNVDLTRKMRYMTKITSKITGIFIWVDNSMFLIDNNSKINYVEYEENNWIDTTPLFSFNGKTY